MRSLVVSSSIYSKGKNVVQLPNEIRWYVDSFDLQGLLVLANCLLNPVS